VIVGLDFCVQSGAKIVGCVLFFINWCLTVAVHGVFTGDANGRKRAKSIKLCRSLPVLSQCHQHHLENKICPRQPSFMPCTVQCVTKVMIPASLYFLWKQASCLLWHTVHRNAYWPTDRRCYSSDMDKLRDYNARRYNNEVIGETPMLVNRLECILNNPSGK